MANTKYLLSFTAGSLLYQESITIAVLFLRLRNWSSVKKEIIEKNLLQSRTQSSAARISREIISRLKVLAENQLILLVEGSRQEQLDILWLAVCKRYQFIKDFAVEVIREKFLRIDMDVQSEDYDAFFNAKAEWHDELEQLTDKTKSKMKQILFRMLKEVDILTQHHTINPFILPPQVGEAISEDDPSYLTIFPISESELMEWSR